MSSGDLPQPPKTNKRVPMRAALWPSRAAGPSPLVCGELQLFDSVQKIEATEEIKKDVGTISAL